MTVRERSKVTGDACIAAACFPASRALWGAIHAMAPGTEWCYNWARDRRSLTKPVINEISSRRMELVDSNESNSVNPDDAP